MHLGHFIFATVVILTNCLISIEAESNQTIIKIEEIEKENVQFECDFNCCPQSRCKQPPFANSQLSMSSRANVINNVTDVTTDTFTYTFYTTDSNLLAAILMTNALAVILTKF